MQFFPTRPLFCRYRTLVIKKQIIICSDAGPTLPLPTAFAMRERTRRFRMTFASCESALKKRL